MSPGLRWLTVGLMACSSLLAASATHAGLFSQSAEPARTTGDFDSAGVKIHYVMAGQGEPVILIHGLYSSAGGNWELPGVFAELAKDYRVIALDCRGHGQSDKPQGNDDYGVKMVEDVVRLMDHLKIPKARFAGYSMGGMISLKMATLHPERMTSVLLGGMGWIEAGSVQQTFWSSMKGGSAISAMFTPPACPRGFAELAVTEAALKAVKIPVEVVIGDHDPCRNLYVSPLQRARPDWPVHIITGAGHILCIFKPDFKVQVKAAIARMNTPAK